MPGLLTIISTKLQYFCCSWIIWGDSAGINWQTKCHFACRAEATNGTPSFNSRALRLRAHTAPFESSSCMGLTEQMTRYSVAETEQIGQWWVWKQRCDLVLSLFQRRVSLSVCLEPVLQAGSCSRKHPVYIPGGIQSPEDTVPLKMASLLLSFTNVAPLRSLSRSLLHNMSSVLGQAKTLCKLKGKVSTWNPSMYVFQAHLNWCINFTYGITRRSVL